MLSMGGSLEHANKVFILPTPPKGNYVLNSDRHLDKPDITDIIEQDGNHWRKILTIMAKLSCTGQDWKTYRDHQLLQQREAIRFQLPDTFDKDVVYFICGGQMQVSLAQMPGLERLDDQGRIKVNHNLILCPYLDYRQYPNQLIETTLSYINSLSL